MRKLFIFFLFLLLSTWIEIKPLHFKESITMQVEVKGALKNEGIFELTKNATWNDVLPLLELHDNADTSQFSLQTVLKNKQIITIPIQKETTLISINTATLEELMTLPGIGPSTAQNIITYRQEVGSFTTLEQLMEIKGLKTAKFNQIKDYICL